MIGRTAKARLLGLAVVLWRRHGARLIRYGVVGVSVSLAYSLILIGCVHLLHPIGPTWANVVTFAITLPVIYRAHRDVTFGDQVSQRHEFARFVLTTVSSFTISTAGMYVITEILRQSYLYGIAWNWLVIPGMNFLIFMLWVFRGPRAAPSGDKTAE